MTALLAVALTAHLVLVGAWVWSALTSRQWLADRLTAALVLEHVGLAAAAVVVAVWELAGVAAVGVAAFVLVWSAARTREVVA